MALTTASTAGFARSGARPGSCRELATVWLIELPVAWIFGVRLDLGFLASSRVMVAYFVVRSAVSVGLARYACARQSSALPRPEPDARADCGGDTRGAGRKRWLLAYATGPFDALLAGEDTGDALDDLSDRCGGRWAIALRERRTALDVLERRATPTRAPRRIAPVRRGAAPPRRAHAAVLLRASIAYLELIAAALLPLAGGHRPRSASACARVAASRSWLGVAAERAVRDADSA